MKIVYWNEKFEVGIPEIDEQHQTLIELINQLSSAISRKDSIFVINDISNKLSPALVSNIKYLVHKYLHESVSGPNLETHRH